MIAVAATATVPRVTAPILGATGTIGAAAGVRTVGRVSGPAEATATAATVVRATGTAATTAAATARSGLPAHGAGSATTAPRARPTGTPVRGVGATTTAAGT